MWVLVRSDSGNQPADISLIDRGLSLFPKNGPEQLSPGPTLSVQQSSQVERSVLGHVAGLGSKYINKKHSCMALLKQVGLLLFSIRTTFCTK